MCGEGKALWGLGHLWWSRAVGEVQTDVARGQESPQAQTELPGGRGKMCLHREKF